MTSLFTPFDMKLFYLGSFFFILSTFFFLISFFKVSILSISLNKLSSVLVTFFLSLKPKMFSKSSSLIFMSIFLMVITINLLSVFSFNFPLSSQVSMVMFLALSLWAGLVIFSLVKNIKGLSSHLIPEGTPLPLTTLLFLIELVSTIIRPLTLMVRLVANILAGHLLLILLSSLVFYMPPFTLLYLLLNLVELMVALIQAYIFTTMVVLYFSEV